MYPLQFYVIEDIELVRGSVPVSGHCSCFVSVDLFIDSQSYLIGPLLRS